MGKSPATEVSGLLGGSTNALSGQLTTITSQLQELQTINQAQVQSIEANTSALGASTGSKSGGASTAGSVGNTLLDVLGLGSGLSPLIFGLFGGGGTPPTTTVTPYIQPLPVNLAAGFTGSAAGGASGVDYGEGGQPRQTTAASAQQQITVQVQAMDSQSFLDRSNDIAAAVRKAMLESSVLNDVVRGV